MSKRIYGETVDINYEKTKEFWELRSKKYNEEHPYVSVKLGDNNYEISEKWDAHEKAEILPKLNIDKDSYVLDIGCGIGRLSEAILLNCRYYCGMDFSENLIEIAKNRIASKAEFDFFAEPIQAISKEMPEIKYVGKYNKIIIAGVLLYINDNDIKESLAKVVQLLADSCTIYIATTVADDKRITLNEWESAELETTYNVVYRTFEEYMELFEPIFENGFSLVEKDGIFSEESRWKETNNQYFIFER